MQTAPGQVQLSWQPVGGASYYVLLGPGVTAGGEKVSGATTFTAKSVPAGLQEWAIASFYDPGPISTAASAFPRVTLNVTPTPVNPSGFSAVQTGPGQVKLSWQPVSGASYYVLLGPGVTAGGQKVSGATTFTATNVPSGPREWAIASFYDPGPISTVASAFPRVTINVTAPTAPVVTSARYRVVATGFKVEHETFDDLLGVDGNGDEVYGGFAMFHVNRANGQVLDQDLRRTKVHGQASGFTDRLSAGSGTDSGGLRSGDDHLWNKPGGEGSFPFVVWDGTLTNAQDAVVILPTMWEWDNDDSAYDDWFLNEKAALPVFWWDKGMQAALTGVRLPTAGGEIMKSKPGLVLVMPPWVPAGPYGETREAADNFATSFGFAGLLPGTSKDRAIGVSLRGSGFDLPRRAIVLTREIIEAELSRPSESAPQQSTSGSSGGSVVSIGNVFEQLRTAQEAAAAKEPKSSTIIAIPLIDGPGPNLGGNYLLHLRVERVP